jgi:hypothetical protein
MAKHERNHQRLNRAADAGARRRCEEARVERPPPGPCAAGARGIRAVATISKVLIDKAAQGDLEPIIRPPVKVLAREN